MYNIIVPTRDQVDPKAQTIFDNLKKNLGMVPNIYAVIGHSANALESFLAFSSAQAQGSFNAKEREAVALAVSEFNGCSYCLAAHTALAKMNGFSEEETHHLRAGTIEDPKLGVLTRLAISIVENKGKANPGLVENFFAAGYNESDLIDLIVLVAERNFANYVGRLAGVPIDFSKAAPLQKSPKQTESVESRN
ncbi:MAG: carboxymuconolactone decarboxylase family protein [Ignavibacteriales bacterium]|nr:carboxymuconolactone decarboxylase family protein [Ignavibacteriales bacterium]